MVKKIYHLLILCGSLLHQILAVESVVNHLVREKRVINSEPNGEEPLMPKYAAFVVNIRESTINRTICVGTILSIHTVITVASCAAQRHASSLHVISASTYSYRGGVFHNVTRISIRNGRHPNRNNDGVALLTVEPRFTYNKKTRPIPLNQGPLLPGADATILGWGCNQLKPYGTNYRYRLRSITVPIMNHRDCVNSYRNHFEISDNDICTNHEYKKCGHTDPGAPLIVHDHLAGLFLWRVEIPGRNSPDVFVVLQSSEYRQWIQNNTIH